MACVICSSHQFRFLFERDRFRIEKCTSCGLVQVTNMPPPERVPDVYDKAFFDTAYTGLDTDTRKQRYVYLNFENKLQQIEKRIGRKGRLLDVGCSFGFFLDAARKRGWSVEGLDVSEYAATYARFHLNLSVQNAPVTAACFPEKSFDVITLWEVIEHLLDPVRALQHLSGFVKDDGMLVMGTPNVDSYLAMIQGKQWRNWEPPAHLLYFSPGTMNRLFERCSLKMVAHETAVPYEKYLRRVKLYPIIDKLQLSDKTIYYGIKNSMPSSDKFLRE
jgi:2-polyprenyl-3-methyl-5-hydroxy-6-metoxy-1,4-benzoquinol methylase